MKRFFLVATLLLPLQVFAQAIYDGNGQYKGYTQTSPNGVTATYNAQGQFMGAQQVDAGQTNYYGPQGQYQGNSAPVYIQPNTNMNTPRQVPQVPAVRGW